MFTKPESPTLLEKEITRVLKDMTNKDPASQEYKNLMERLQALHKMADDNRPPRVSPDTALLSATNILGILLIIRHEYVNVITSKAQSFVQKLR
jgi:hypothetical protein